MMASRLRSKSRNTACRHLREIMADAESAFATPAPAPIDVRNTLAAAKLV
jgi:hypothetical protein